MHKAPRPLSARSATEQHDHKTPCPPSARSKERSHDHQRGPNTVSSAAVLECRKWYSLLVQG
eukprot:8282200-Alexandrium_andersonii.AAC.1